MTTDSPLYRLLVKQGASEPEAEQAVKSVHLDLSCRIRDELGHFRAEIASIRNDVAKWSSPPSSATLSTEDVRKLHAEINQIVNQRFFNNDRRDNRFRCGIFANAS